MFFQKAGVLELVARGDKAPLSAPPIGAEFQAKKPLGCHACQPIYDLLGELFFSFDLYPAG